MVLRSRSVIVSWQAPCAGWIKENFDGFLLNGAGGGGVLFRECGGRPLMMTGRMFKAGRIFNVGSMVDTELKAAWLAGSTAYNSFKEWSLFLEEDLQQVECIL